MSTQFSSICAIDRIQPGAITPDQSGLEDNDNKWGLCIPQSSSIIGASPWYCLVSYPGHTLGESYPSAEMHLVNSAAPADWARLCNPHEVMESKSVHILKIFYCVTHHVNGFKMYFLRI